MSTCGCCSIALQELNAMHGVPQAAFCRPPSENPTAGQQQPGQSHTPDGTRNTAERHEARPIERWSDRKKGLSRAALLENIYFFARVKQRRTQGGRLTEWEKSAASSGCDLAHTQSASTSYRVVANTADGEQQTKISCTEIGPLTINSQAACIEAQVSRSPITR